MKKIYMGLIILLLAFLLIGCKGKTTDGGTTTGTGDTIVFGSVSPLTGEATIYGLEDKNAMLLAVDKINSEGGIDGKQLEIMFEDGKCTGKEAATAAQKLINVEKVKVILGGGCSGETLAIAPLAEESKVLLFSSLSTSPDITNAGDFVFRNSPSDTDSAAATADLAYENGIRSIGIIAENTDYAQGFKRVFIERFEELGGTVTAAEDYPPETTDFRTIITKVLATEPEALLLDPQGANGGIVAKQVDEQGYEGALYGNIVLAGQEVLNKYGQHMEGMYMSDAAGLDVDTNAKAAAFMTLYETEYGEKPSFDYYAGARYDSVFILKEAIEAVGYDSEAIRDYLYELQYDGVLGSYGFDENGDVEGISFADRQVMNSEVKIL